MVKAGEDLTDKFKVFGRIDRPAQRAIVRDVVDEGDLEATRGRASLQCSVFSVQCGVLVEIGHHMLPLVFLVGFFPRSFECGESANFGVQANWKTASHWRR